MEVVLPEHNSCSTFESVTFPHAACRVWAAFEDTLGFGFDEIWSFSLCTKAMHQWECWLCNLSSGEAGLPAVYLGNAAIYGS